MPTFSAGSGVSDEYATISFEVLDDAWFKSALFGALFELTIPENWVEMGDVDVSLAVEEAARMIDAYVFTEPFFTGLGDLVPDVINSADSGNLEIGAHFHTTVSGNILGVRFYKSVDNTGLHKGYLYSPLCAELWEVDFTDESASGWQEQLFPEPIPINACDDYLVTYSCPNGHYSATAGGFSSGISNPPIIFPGGHNGVYAYGDAPLCPDNVYLDTNYFVDVIFQPSFS